MKLLIILLCLLSERYLIHKISQQRFNWFTAYCNKIAHYFPQSNLLTNSTFFLLAVILPPLVITWIILMIADHLLFGFITFLLNLIIFYYCLGPDNPFYPIREEAEADNSESAARTYFAQVNGQLFAVIFWFVITGALGVLCYRLISLCRDQEKTTNLAILITDILDWIPARITVLLYLLVGNFQKGVHFYSQKFLSSPTNNNYFLSEGGLLAARTTENEPVELTYAQNLVEHAVIVYLVFLALFTLIALL